MGDIFFLETLRGLSQKPAKYTSYVSDINILQILCLPILWGWCLKV